MILDLDLLDSDAVLEADLCLVGSGAAGTALALECIGSPFDVLVLEGGGLEREPRSEALLETVNVGLSHAGSIEGRARVLGGTTTRWAGQALPLEPIDFEKRLWVPHSGWPIARATLDAFYPRAEKVLHLNGARYDERVWQRFGLDVPALSQTDLDYRFSQFSLHPDFNRTYRKTLEEARNVRVMLHANVTSISLNEHGSVAGHVEVQSLRGRRVQARASVFVLCAGGIDTPRLLLNSTSVMPRGVGNDRDLVGRFFQEHPNAFVGTVHADTPRVLQERFRLLYGDQRRYFPKVVLTREAQRRERTLGSVANLTFETDPKSGLNAAESLYRALRRRKLPDEPLRVLGRIALGLPQVLFWGARFAVHRKAPAPLPQAIRLHVHLEQAPNPDSRITLSNVPDATGMPKARIDWRLSDLDYHTLRVMTRAVQKGFGKTHLGEVHPEPWIDDEVAIRCVPISESYHHMGTTRMAAHAAEGVVDEACRVFGISNLYVCSSAVFPTSGYSNPTLTIIALAMRLADHLKNVLR